MRDASNSVTQASIINVPQNQSDMLRNIRQEMNDTTAAIHQMSHLPLFLCFLSRRRRLLPQSHCHPTFQINCSPRCSLSAQLLQKLRILNIHRVVCVFAKAVLCAKDNKWLDALKIGVQPFAYLFLFPCHPLLPFAARWQRGVVLAAER